MQNYDYNHIFQNWLKWKIEKVLWHVISQPVEHETKAIREMV